MSDSSAKSPWWRKLIPSWTVIALIAFSIILHLIWALIQGDAILKWVFDFGFAVAKTTERSFAGFFQLLGVPNFELPVVILVFLVGRWLYMFRCRKAKWYGVAEVISGLFIATFIVGQIKTAQIADGPSIPPYAAALFTTLGALYIIVRGYDNMYRSLEGEDRHHWNRKFFGKDTNARL